MIYDTSTKAAETQRLLLDKTEIEPDLGDYRGSEEGFSMWQQAFEPDHYQRPFEERFSVAFLNAHKANGPGVVRKCLGSSHIQCLPHAVVDKSFGATLLHAAACSLGNTVAVLPSADEKLTQMDRYFGMISVEPTKDWKCF